MWSLSIFDHHNEIDLQNLVVKNISLWRKLGIFLPEDIRASGSRGVRVITFGLRVWIDSFCMRCHGNCEDAAPSTALPISLYSHLVHALL